MSNSQTIQENNERINAVTELLKSKAAAQPTEVYDGLDSTSTTAALSANQGRVLKESIPTNYGASLSLTIDSSTYVVTAQLKDPAGNNLGEAQTIDLPLESVVISGGYDESTKEVVLTLKDNSVIRFSIGDLIDGLVSSGQLANYYTKSEVDGKIPTKTSQLNNDSGFLTEHQSLSNYYTKGEVESTFTKKTDTDKITNNTTIIGPANAVMPLVVGKGATADTSQGTEYSTAIGNNASTYQYGTAVGNNAKASATGTCVGRNSSASNYSVSVGAGAHTTAQKAIQIGEGINSTADTLQVFDKNIYNHSTDTLTVHEILQDGKQVANIEDLNNVVGVYDSESAALEASLANPNKICLY